jgi:hypothetical protein
LGKWKVRSWFIDLSSAREALQGANEVRKDQNRYIPFIGYVTSSVKNSAGELGAEQNPCC